MEIFAASGLVNAIIASAFGILVILKNWKIRANQLYFLMTFSLAVWAFAYWRWLLVTNDSDLALFWVKVLSIGSLFIPVFFFHWIVKFLGIEKINKYVVIVSYLAVLSMLFFVDTPYFINDLQPAAFFPFWPKAGSVYDIYFSYFYLGLITYTIYLLFRSYWKEKDRNKKGQILFIILGSVLGFGGGLSNFPLWFGIPILPYGNFLVAAFPFCLGYSVLKFKLFSAKTIATEILVFFISVISLVEAVLSKSGWEMLFRGGIFVVITFFGYLLIKSVYREVEQRERIEKLALDLESANKRLTELDRQKSEFVSFASHQLRAPLTAMKGYGSLLLEGDLGELPRQARDGVERIFESTKTLVNIVDDYLNVSRIELGTMKYNFETIDLKTLVEDVVAELKPNIEKIGLKFEFSAENNGTDYRMTADRDKLKQVIANLIDNSVKYTPSGTVSVSLSYNRPKHVLVFQVKDTGIGIDPEVLPHLFQKFSRAGNAGRVNIKGTGLGLFVAKQMVEAHHGSIRAESAGEGKGSAFIVELEPFRVV